MKLVRLPANKDDTVTLAPLFDFRAKPPRPLFEEYRDIFEQIDDINRYLWRRR